MLQQIDIAELKPGMFVNSVIEQTGTLKIKQKGLVKTARSITSLKNKGVTRVEIDLSRCEQSNPAAHFEDSQDDTNHEKIVPIGEQIDAATILYDQALKIQDKFFAKLEKNESPSLTEVKQLGHSIIDSVFSMPQGLTCVSMLNKTGKYLLEHSLNCSILMTMFGKHRDMTEQQIEDLTMSGLLMDVGMTNMPKDITESSKKLSETQKEIVTTHVDIGLDLVERCGDVSDNVRDVIFNHHERVDGSGYPDSQTGFDVSLFARMAAIVDSYDAMTSERPFRKPMTPSKALRSLLKDKAYDQVLVAEFVQCIGVHPTGSLVKLSNDKLGIVLKGNKLSPLKPVVGTFYNIKSATYTEVKKVDLTQSQVQVESAVRPEEFGLNLTKFFREIFSAQV